MSISTTTSTEDRALKLLGQGLGPEIVAATIGVEVSRISQLLADEEFRKKVATIRFESLSKNNDRDSSYDSLEDKLLEKLEKSLEYNFSMKPMEISRILQTVNNAKRRGATSPEAFNSQGEVVSLVMPTIIQNNYTKQSIVVNIANQVVKAGEQDLVTIQSNTMNSLLQNSREAKQARVAEIAALPSPTSNNILPEIFAEDKRVKIPNSSGA